MTNRPPDKKSAAVTALDHVFMDTGDAENPVYVDSESGSSVYGSTHGSTQGSATPRASRCPSPALEQLSEIATDPFPPSGKEGGDGFDPEKTPSADEDMSDADSQYETDAEDLYEDKEKRHLSEREFPPPLSQARNQSKGLLVQEIFSPTLRVGCPHQGRWWASRQRRYSRRCGWTGGLQDGHGHPVFLVSVALSV